MQDDISSGGGERQGVLAGSNGLVVRAQEIEVRGQKDRDLSQPTLVVKGYCKRLSLAQVCQDTPIVAEQPERRAQREPEIDSLLVCVALLGQMWKGAERLLEIPHSLTVG